MVWEKLEIESSSLLLVDDVSDGDEKSSSGRLSMNTGNSKKNVLPFPSPSENPPIRPKN